MLSFSENEAVCVDAYFHWCPEIYAVEPYKTLSNYTDEDCMTLHLSEMAWIRQMQLGISAMPQATEGHVMELWTKYNTDNLTGYNSSHSEYFALQPPNGEGGAAAAGKRGPAQLKGCGGANGHGVPDESCGQYAKMCPSNAKLAQQWVNDSMYGLVPGVPVLSQGAIAVPAIEDDGGSGFCTCDKCMQLDSPRLPKDWDGRCTGSNAGGSDSGRLTDRYIYFANAVSDELKRRLPNESIWTTYYAYDCYKQPPRKLKLRGDRDFVYVVTFGGYPSAVRC